MSWFTRSIANTLQQLDLNNADDHTDQIPPKHQEEEEDPDHVEDNAEDSPLSPNRGVKEDLSEITKTLSRQFWGVASFLAPPPPPEPEHSDHESDQEDEAPEAISGIRRDFAEIGGRFRSGISKLKTNIDVSEITKIATNFLQLSADGEDYVLNKEAGEAIGVTDEVVAFVRDITMHPETWLDFPLPDFDDQHHVQEDFELSDAQQEHALTVESLAPRLAALRIELCPGYMSESSFWKIYFVLLHPRLEPHAAELLSTPEIVKARAALKYELKGRSSSQAKEEEGSGNNLLYSEFKPDSSQEQHLPEPSGVQSESVPLELSTTQASTSGTSVDAKTEKHPIPSEEVQIVDKSVIQEEPRNATETNQNVAEDKDDDDWLKDDDDKDDNSENVTGTTTIPIENDEDVSFSDLEEDDGDVPANYKNGSDSSTKDSRDWVQLGSDSSTAGPRQVSGRNSEAKVPNDWLDVDDIDVA
uniref:uncharacterized protein LOC122589819 n=1 Tax=Erigeron canadensis TaxID=72917 RepID=UPI001CB9B0B4|nr:uncharacterized protein LOC122589819 [Erigeron canadensis]